MLAGGKSGRTRVAAKHTCVNIVQCTACNIQLELGKQTTVIRCIFLKFKVNSVMIYASRINTVITAAEVTTCDVNHSLVCV